MTFERRRLARVMLTVALAVVPSVAQAQDDARAVARAELSEGNRLFTLRRYAEAAVTFERALRAFPSANIQFNLGQAYRALGRDRDAVACFRRFLAEAPEAEASLRTEAEGYVRELTAPLKAPRPRLAAPAPARVRPAFLPSPSSVQAAPLLDPSRTPPARAPVYQRWWFWTAAGLLAGAGATAWYLAPPDPLPGAVGPDGSHRAHAAK